MNTLKKKFCRRFAVLLVLVSLVSPIEAKASVVTQSIFALLGVKSSLDSGTAVQFVRNWNPSLSETKIRAAYAGVLVSAIAGANLLVWQLDPRIAKDYEGLAYNMGEFLLGFVVGHFYFNQPLVPGQH